MTGRPTPDRPVDGSGLRLVILAASGWHTDLVGRMVATARAASIGCGVEVAGEVHVTGAGELPLAAQALARRDDVDALVALAVVIRGATAHADLVMRRASEGLLQVALDEGTPIGDGVVAAQDQAQAEERVEAAPAAAVRAAVQLATVLRTAKSPWGAGILQPPSPVGGHELIAAALNGEATH
jgi:6,7-dimethyl-8-ribityllumazine synthase